jgi:Tfp pilus assembly protein PilF
MKPFMPEKNRPRAILLASAVIALAGLLAYSNSFSAPFVFDSASIIAHNPTLPHLGSAWRPPHDGSTVDGRPLLNLSLALNYAISGTQVWSYHALNVLIHILAGLALFGIVRRTLEKVGTGGPPVRERGKTKSKQTASRPLPPYVIAFAVALLWILHPLQTEAVTYVIQRAESMMGLFYLLTLYCFIRGAGGEGGASSSTARRNRTPKDGKAGGEGWFLLAMLCCLLGMATKEVMVSAPVIVFLYDRTFLSGSFREAWRRRRRLHLSLASTWILLACLEIGTGSRRGTAGFGVSLRWSDYALTQIYAVGHYLRLALWPRPLIFDYGTAVVTQPSLIVPATIVVTLLAVGTLVALVRRPALGFLGACFFAILAPTCLVPVATQTIAEHRMYLPLAAVVVLIALGIARLPGKAGRMIFALVAVGLGAATVQRNETYGSEIALWSDNVAKLPDDARAHNNLGSALYAMGQVPEAAEQYAQALRLQPDDNPEAHYNLGLSFLQQGRLPEALSHLTEAVRLAPENAMAHNSLAEALAASGRMPEAMAQYQIVLRRNPGDAGAHNNLGNALAQSGRMPEAMAQYQAALAIDPDNAITHDNLGHIWLFMGQRANAMREFEAALRINPALADARASLDRLQAPGGAP